MDFLGGLLDVVTDIPIGGLMIGGGLLYAGQQFSRKNAPRQKRMNINFRQSQPHGGRPRVKALYIGINYKGQQGELRGCVNDVAKIQEVMRQLQFPIQEQMILVDDPRFPGSNGLPTLDNIMKAMHWLVDGNQAGDTLLFHYSGHGSQVRDETGDEEDGMDETLVPVDFKKAGQLRDDDIFKIMVQPLRPGVRLTAIMDCCHSGTLLDLPFEYVVGNKQCRHNGSRKNTQADVVMFSGCQDAQTSADVTVASMAGGACTNALADVLLHTSGLSVGELVQRMQDEMRRKRYSQRPQLSSSKPLALNKSFSFFGSLDDQPQQPRPQQRPPSKPVVQQPQVMYPGQQQPQQHQQQQYYQPPQQQWQPPPQQQGYQGQPPQQQGYQPPPPQQQGYPGYQAPPQQQGNCMPPPQHAGYPPQAGPVGGQQHQQQPGPPLGMPPPLYRQY